MTLVISGGFLRSLEHMVGLSSDFSQLPWLSWVSSLYGDRGADNSCRLHMIQIGAIGAQPWGLDFSTLDSS